MNEMNALAKEVVTQRIAVPGVQPKLSLSLINDTFNDSNHPRLTVVGALGGNYIFNRRQSAILKCQKTNT